jgi:hypothetical protein
MGRGLGNALSTSFNLFKLTDRMFDFSARWPHMTLHEFHWLSFKLQIMLFVVVCCLQDKLWQSSRSMHASAQRCLRNQRLD